MKLKLSINEIIGWYGALAIISAYSFVSFEIITPSNLVYLLLNITGSIGILFSSYLKKDYQPVALNFFWALIGIIALVKILI